MYFKTFTSTNAILGEGSIKYLETIGESRIAILMGGESQKNVVDEIVNSLQDLGKQCKIIGNIKREPHMSDVEGPLKEVLEFNPDCILAIGGGAVIDAAKVVWAFYEHPNLNWENVILPNPVPKLGEKAILIAIPTTSGTGSETSSCSVIVDSDQLEKKLIIHQNIMPTKTILDAELVYSMPKSLAANSGMDAFAHAIEAATNKADSHMVQRLALVTILDIFKHLPSSVNENSDSKEFKQSREIMHLASYQAGICITNAGTGLAHNFDQIGPKLNIPHGLVCAIILPNVVEFTGEHPFYKELSQYLGYRGDKDSAIFIADKIRELNKSIGIPLTFKELNIGDEYLEEMKEALELGINSGGLQFAAKIPTYQEAEDFMLKSYYGK